MDGLVRVTFVPGDAHADVEPGTTVLSASSRAGLVISAPCGGRGACGRCAVTVVDGQLEPPDDIEAQALKRARVSHSDIRLACMARVAGPVTVRARSLTSASSSRVSGRQGTRRRTVAAVDLGTTTVSATVLDSVTGERLGSATVGNRQAVHGADILSRITAVLEGRGMEMRDAAEASMIEAVELACQDAGVAAVGFGRIVVAANTAMLSLVAGADVSGLAIHPFGHSMPDPVLLWGGALGDAYPGVDILALPPLAAFVGGDLTAGLIAQGLVEEASGVAYLDVGTNAEIAVMSGEAVHVASAPAGPAFEGWGISCGGPADECGMVAVEVSGRDGWRPITPGEEPTHLTGSGLLSVVAALRRLGHLDEGGRFVVDGPLEGRFFTLQDAVRAIALREDAADRTLYLSQLDVRSFQYAKAAVSVALRSCCASAGVGGDALAEYVLAGSFGGALAESDLILVGVIPCEAAGRLRHAGEAALAGAAAVALDPGLLDVARAFVGRVTHVDLAVDGSFADHFVAQMDLVPYSLGGR